ncbi:TPA: hypothetical protein ACH3X2_003446 [Trebouxia sp. C0005]
MRKMVRRTRARWTSARLAQKIFGLREQIAKTVAPFSCPANQHTSKAMQLRRTQTSSDQAFGNNRTTSLTASNNKSTQKEKSVFKSKPAQPAQKYNESGPSCPATGLLPAAQKPEIPHSNSGSRVNNPLFHATNCLDKAHIPGKRGRQEGTPEPEAGDGVISKSKAPKKLTTSTEAASVQHPFLPAIYLT